MQMIENVVGRCITPRKTDICSIYTANQGLSASELFIHSKSVNFFSGKSRSLNKLDKLYRLSMRHQKLEFFDRRLCCICSSLLHSLSVVELHHRPFYHDHRSHKSKASWQKLDKYSTNRQKCRAQGGNKSSWPLSFGKQIETDALSPVVRDNAMKAIDECGGRVTVGDVSTRAGLKLSQAETALKALAADSGGFLEVSDEGDVLYVFPKDYRSKLLSKSLRLKFEPLFDKLKAAGEYFIRVSFGTTLLASIVVVYGSILVLLTSMKSEDNNRSNRGGYASSQRSYGSNFNLFISPSDLFWYWDPLYFRRRRARGGGMNFLESVFSFVFGDGDPNEGLEDIRWKAIGDRIANKGGVVTAEELAPFVDVSSSSEDDESFILPVLLRFDGQPEVDGKGNILYRFPSLQRTATTWFGQKKEELKYFMENVWNFSKATQMERALVIGLGAFNLLGVIILGTLLNDFSMVGQMRGILPVVAKFFPLLQLYTVAFFAIPFVRWLLLQKKNTEIRERNRARMERAMLLDRPPPSLQDKLRNARDMARRTFIGKERIIYSTEKDMQEQDIEAREWEKQFEEKYKETN